MYGITKITDHLWISDIESVREQSTNQFDTVVTVCQDGVSDNVSCNYEHIELADGMYDTFGGDCTLETFTEAADIVVEALESDQKTLVHCHAGISRSVSVSVAALATTSDIRATDALELIREKRPRANPNKTLQKRVSEYLDDNAFEQADLSLPEHPH